MTTESGCTEAAWTLSSIQIQCWGLSFNCSHKCVLWWHSSWCSCLGRSEGWDKKTILRSAPTQRQYPFFSPTSYQSQSCSKEVRLWAWLLCVGTLCPIFILSLNTLFPVHCLSEIKGYRVVIRNKGLRLIAAWHTHYYWICICLTEV